MVGEARVCACQDIRFNLAEIDTCCWNNLRIGAKTYRIGHVIGTDSFDLDAPTIGIYISLAINLGESSLPSLIFFGVLGESVELGEMPFWGFQGQKW